MSKLNLHRKMSVILGLMEQYYPTGEFDSIGDGDVAALLAIMPKIVVTVKLTEGKTQYIARMLNLDGETLTYSEQHDE